MVGGMAILVKLVSVLEVENTQNSWILGLWQQFDGAVVEIWNDPIKC